MQNNVHILCTRPLPESLIAEAMAQGIAIDEFSFIETEPILSAEVKADIDHTAQQSNTVVFTSMNAVDAVANYLAQQQVQWRIYCMGTTTNELVKKYFGAEQLKGIANSAAELATLIASDVNINSVTFFCGDQRRDELPDILSSHHIAVKEIPVYKTIKIEHTISKTYDGILFFSPTAVESFFSSNEISPSTVLFSIGNTTGKAIKKYSNNTIITGELPGKDHLARTMMQYFSNLHNNS